MKKRLFFVSALLPAMLIQAQEAVSDEVLKNKKGHEILPKKGDIGLGFNAVPILDAITNMIRLNQTVGGQNAAANQFVQGSNNQIVGKYYLTAKSAIRVRFGLNTLSGSFVNQVQDAEAMYKATLGTLDDIEAAKLLKTEDKLKFSKTNTFFSIGYEMRRGYRRLQGFYGAELAIGGTTAKQQVTYGNNFSDKYQVEYTSNFNADVTSFQNPGDARVTRNLNTRENGGIRLGLRGFIGIEYFVFSKISIAAEYGWGYSFARIKGKTSTREVYQVGQNGPSVFNEDVDADNSEKTKGFSVDNNSGSIFSMNNTLGGNTALNGGAGAISIIFHF